MPVSFSLKSDKGLCELLCYVMLSPINYGSVSELVRKRGKVINRRNPTGLNYKNNGSSQIIGI